MNRVVVGALAAAALVCVTGPAAAQPYPVATTPKVFTTVDAVAVQNGWVVVTGVVDGDLTASSWAWRPYSATDSAALAQYLDTCYRAALMAMAKPGQYRLELTAPSGSSYHHCKLIRATP
jgi:hypothetical protein